MLKTFSLCLQYNYMNRGSLTFDPLTLVPIQVKMMNTDMLTQKEVQCFHHSCTRHRFLLYNMSNVHLGGEGRNISNADSGYHLGLLDYGKKHNPDYFGPY